MLSHYVTQANDWKGHPNPIHEHCHVFGLLHSAASPRGGFQTQVAKKGACLEQEGGAMDKSPYHYITITSSTYELAKEGALLLQEGSFFKKSDSQHIWALHQTPNSDKIVKIRTAEYETKLSFPIF